MSAPRSALLWIALAFGVGGCSTPSVPLPPPAVDTSALRFATAGDGTVVMHGEARYAHESVRFFVIDQQSGDGVITQTAADGSFTTPALKATIGDVAELYFEQSDGHRSETTCVTVLVDQSLVGASCP